MMYYRILVHYSSPKTGKPVGVFGAMYHLTKAGWLTADEGMVYEEIKAWFEDHLPNPPYYDDGNSIGAVTWFKSTSREMMDRLDPLIAILTKYGVTVSTAESVSPGVIVYEDASQVGVIDEHQVVVSPDKA